MRLLFLQQKDTSQEKRGTKIVDEYISLISALEFVENVELLINLRGYNQCINLFFFLKNISLRDLQNYVKSNLNLCQLL